jgi:hypothetical protein
LGKNVLFSCTPNYLDSPGDDSEGKDRGNKTEDRKGEETTEDKD